MAQWFHTLAALPEDLDSIPNTHMWLTTVCDTSPKEAYTSALLWYLDSQIYMYCKHADTYT